MDSGLLVDLQQHVLHVQDVQVDRRVGMLDFLHLRLDRLHVLLRRRCRSGAVLEGRDQGTPLFAIADGFSTRLLQIFPQTDNQRLLVGQFFGQNLRCLFETTFTTPGLGRSEVNRREARDRHAKALRKWISTGNNHELISCYQPAN